MPRSSCVGTSRKASLCFPKSSNPVHIKENIDIFDFELTEEEMNEIRQLDKGFRYFTMTLKEQEEALGQFVPAD